MNRRAFLLAGAAVAGVGPAACAGLGAAAGPVPPRPERRPVRIEQLGRVRIDPYAWLKDPEWLRVWREPETLSLEIRRHLERENAYADAVLAPTEDLMRALRDELAARAPVDANARDVADGPWVYLTRLADGASHPMHVRRPAAGGAEEVLLDEEAAAADTPFFHVIASRWSADHRWFAWTEDETGAERFTLKVKNLETGVVRAVAVERAFGDFAFTPDSRAVVWTERDANSRPARVFRTPLDGGGETLLHAESDPGMFMQVAKTASGAFVLIRIFNADTSETRIVSGDAPPRIFAAREPGVFYDIDHWGDAFVVRANVDGAVDFKLMRAPLDAAGRGAWRDWIAYEPGRVIVDMRAFETGFVWLERVDAKLVLRIADGAGAPRTVAFDEAAYAVALDHETAYGAPAARVFYESPVTPPRRIDVDLATGARTARTGGPAPDLSDYEVRRLDAPSSDGVQVPLVVLMRRGAPLDGSAPLLLHGYGSYGYSTEDAYAPADLALVDRGFIVATAHVRGGGERGRAWYEAARQTRKTNSFIDFIACANHLVAEGYARAGRIVSYGYSAGGLLVGASLNMRPDLFAGVIARAPYVDCLNTMSDDAHPLVPLARPDWGDPLVDPEAYEAIAAYSPYENVRPQAYPAVFATTAVSDDRVGYWEPAKWVAALRYATTSGRPVLLRTQMAGGHGGGGGRLDALTEEAERRAFAVWAVEG